MLWEKVKELEEKHQQLINEINNLEGLIRNLPSGHLEVKELRGKKYYYLRYWEDGRLKSKYIGKDPSEIEGKLKHAVELKTKLSLLRQEKEKIERILGRISNLIEENFNS